AAVSVTRRGGHDVKQQSSESGPQVLLDLGDGAFTTTASDLTVTASPLLPDGVPPRGAFDGNAYRISVSAPAQLLPDKAQGYLFLRAAVMTSPDPVVVHRARPQDPWVEQRTSRVGRDNLSTPFRAMGDYAVIRLPGAKPIESIAPSTSKWLRIGGIVVAALVLGALIIRSRREPTP
ncbi:MAG: hypothetical protein JWM40_2788, partial [Frankiales bacterium]|nr:hypothetical protein [Frankiales bacterium]